MRCAAAMQFAKPWKKFASILSSPSRHSRVTDDLKESKGGVAGTLANAPVRSGFNWSETTRLRMRCFIGSGYFALCSKWPTIRICISCSSVQAASPNKLTPKAPSNVAFAFRPSIAACFTFINILVSICRRSPDRRQPRDAFGRAATPADNGNNFRRDRRGFAFRQHAEPLERIGWFHKRVVVRENHLRAVPGFKRDLRRVLCFGEPVTAKRMAQRILFPLQVSGLCRVFLRYVKFVMPAFPDVSLLPIAFRKPCGEVVADWHDATRRCFRFVRADGDMPAL